MRSMDNFATMTATSRMLGAKLRHFRDKKNYTQEYMAERLGVTQSTYSRWEAGESVPKLDALKLAAEVLEVPEQQLLTSEPLILTQHNAMNGGYIVTQHNHVPAELVEKLVAQHAEHIKQFETLCNRLTDIIERHLAGK
jgi:transcriptional regulator with XRE-family HTH domain